MTVDYRTRLTGPVASTDSNAFNQKGIGIIVTNILAIGNSFSQDASRYIHRIARADGVTLNITNLYIGGCPLERHFRNMRSDARDYSLDYNGVEKVHRDTFHASRGLGRYAMGLLWYRMLTGAEVKDNTFCDFDEPVEEAHIQLAKEFVDSCTPLF